MNLQTKGKDLVTIAKEFQRIRETQKDYLVPTARLEAKENGTLHFLNGSDHEFKPTNWAFGQMATYADVPKAYADRLRSENARLMADNLNHGFQKHAIDSQKAGKAETRMLRTIDGNLRGFVSSRFQPFDGYDMANTIFPIAMDNGLSPRQMEITEKRFYARFVSEQLVGEVKKGDVVRYGFMASTSDVGAGSAQIEGFFERLACLNGLIVGHTFRRFHVGKDQGSDRIEEFFSEKTRALTVQAIASQMHDVVASGLTKEVFQRELAKLQAAANNAITNFDLPEVVELAGVRRA